MSEEIDIFTRRFEAERPFYEAWGTYVKETIISQLEVILGSKDKVNYFIKIPPSPRVKNIDSLIAKAFYRKKEYSNPYDDITDKVGLRVVVLLLNDIKTIEDIIYSTKIWSASKDKDFEKEIEEDPFTFSYQSVHFIVRNTIEIQTQDGIIIPNSTPCEVQIRTLLQHAYSELAHDTIYKPQDHRIPSNKAKRLVARSMALIETTDHTFEQTELTLQENQKPQLIFYRFLKEIHQHNFNLVNFEDRFNLNLLFELSSIFIKTKEDISALQTGITSLLESKPYILDRIKAQINNHSFIYRQPIIILLYYLAANHENELKVTYPLDGDHLKQIYIDLGLPFEN